MSIFINEITILLWIIIWRKKKRAPKAITEATNIAFCWTYTWKVLWYQRGLWEECSGRWWQKWTELGEEDIIWMGDKKEESLFLKLCSALSILDIIEENFKISLKEIKRNTCIRWERGLTCSEQICQWNYQTLLFIRNHREMCRCHQLLEYNCKVVVFNLEHKKKT